MLAPVPYWCLRGAERAAAKAAYEEARPLRPPEVRFFITHRPRIIFSGHHVGYCLSARGVQHPFSNLAEQQVAKEFAATTSMPHDWPVIGDGAELFWVAPSGARYPCVIGTPKLCWLSLQIAKKLEAQIGATVPADPANIGV
jgi:hypothetical protein